MEWSAVAQFIDPPLLIVVAVCWTLGFALKRTPRVPDWTIVYVVTLAAVAAVIGLAGPSVQSVLQGLLCGAVAVYGHQLVKQAREGTDEPR